MLVCEEHLVTLNHLSDTVVEHSDYGNECADNGHTYCVSYNRSHSASDGDITIRSDIHFTPFVSSPFEPSPSTSPDAPAVYDNFDDTPVTPPIQGLCIYYILNESLATPMDMGTVTPSDELLVYILAYNTNDLLTPSLRPFSSLSSLPISPTTTSPLAHNDISSSNPASVKEPLHICLSTLNSQQHQQQELKQEQQEQQYSPVYESPLDRLTHKLKRMAVATAMKNK